MTFLFGLRYAKHTSVPILSFNGGNKFRLWQFYAALRIDVPLGTAARRRLCWVPVCGANLSRAFFNFPKRTVGLIDKCAGFWYDERMKRWIGCCTLPMQGLLLYIYGCEYHQAYTLPIQVSPHLPSRCRQNTIKTTSKLVVLIVDGLAARPNGV